MRQSRGFDKFACLYVYSEDGGLISPRSYVLGVIWCGPTWDGVARGWFLNRCPPVVTERWAAEESDNFGLLFTYLFVYWVICLRKFSMDPVFI